MKNFVYERYNYSFLDKKEIYPYFEWTENKAHPYYGLEIEQVLQQFIGCVNNEMTRERARMAIQLWADVNNYEVKVNELEFE